MNTFKKKVIKDFFISLKNARNAFIAKKYKQAVYDTNRYYFFGYKTGLLSAHIITVNQWLKLDKIIHKLFD